MFLGILKEKNLNLKIRNKWYLPVAVWYEEGEKQNCKKKEKVKNNKRKLKKANEHIKQLW